MSDLNQSNSSRPETGLEKVLKYAIPAGVAVLVFVFWAAIVSFVKQALMDTVETIILGVILCVMLYGLWWLKGNYRYLLGYISDMFVEYNPLFFVYRAIEQLKEKRQVLQENVNVISGQRQKLDRQIKNLEKAIRDNGNLGVSALKQNNREQAGVYGQMVEEDKASLAGLMELQAVTNTSITKMQKIYDHFGYTIQGLEHSAARKEQEWAIVKPLVKGLKSAEDFINSDSKIIKDYGLGMKALEDKITQSLGYADEFERRSKGVIDRIDVEKGSLQIQGLKALESFMDDKSLLLPTNFGNEFTKENFNNNLQTIAAPDDKKKTAIELFNMD